MRKKKEKAIIEQSVVDKANIPSEAIVIGAGAEKTPCKIAMYAICKNEINNIEKWYERAKEADYVCVLDTGSTDGSFEKLKELGIITEQKEIIPWRFDVARNESMKLIPKDAVLCMCTDLDEEIVEGWAQILRNVHEKYPQINQLEYRFAQSLHTDGTPDNVYFYNKIHSNDHNWQWRYPVHEGIDYMGDRSKVFKGILNDPYIFLYHHPDLSKKRDYIDLLKIRQQENPSEFVSYTYLGNAYIGVGGSKEPGTAESLQNFEIALDYFKQGLTVLKNTWEGFTNNPNVKDDQNRPEFWASIICGYISDLCCALNKLDDGIAYADAGINYFPKLQDCYIMKMRNLLNKKEYKQVIAIGNYLYTVKPTKRYYNWLENSRVWQDVGYELMGLAYYNIGDYASAYSYTMLAAQTNKDNTAAAHNVDVFLTLLKN